MTTITLELPDDLALRLGSLKNHLPNLLYEVLSPSAPKTTRQTLKTGVVFPVYQEMIDFLASGPTPEQIIAHRPSGVFQERLAELLDKNREGGLTEAESVELDSYEQVDDLMSLLKARAHAAKC
jgi:hypothetical protein